MSQWSGHPTPETCSSGYALSGPAACRATGYERRRHGRCLVVEGARDDHVLWGQGGESLMEDASRQAHWENVYTTKGENEVSWFQQSPAPSLELIDLAQSTAESAIVDIGGGASRLVDRLVARRFSHVTVLDISDAALEVAKARLGARASEVQWIVADVPKWRPMQPFDIWHDRAAFHFLTESADKA